jgi:hypothetical protein
MWQFGFPALTWGFLLALVPLLIHLINLLRHQRVQWAAMDFLLQSYKKHRKWVWLRQFLLLASRIAVICLLVAMLAQWKPQHRLFARFSGAAAHHYVLLDDSFSMAERVGDATVFDRAIGVVQAIARRAQEQEGPQRFTLIRFSRAAEGGGPAANEPSEGALAEWDLEDLSAVADLNAEPVDGRFEARLEEQRRRLTVSQLATGPFRGLQLIRQLIAEDEAPSKLVYVVSDFRTREWRNPAELRSALVELQGDGAEVELVSCARQGAGNLGILEIQPDAGPRVAGVPLAVNVTVQNFGTQPSGQVQLRVRSHFFDDSRAGSTGPGDLEPRTEDLPVELIESILPGETVTQRVQVFFPQPGRHVVEAILPDDPLPTDNRRWCVVQVRTAEPGLVIDGDPERRHAFYLDSIFQPGPRARTGIQPRLEPATYLRDVPIAELNEYQAIYLLDVERLDPRAVENLENYVRQGGGVAFFLGPQVDPRFYRDTLYRQGEGLFPFPVGQQDLLPPSRQNEPDVIIEGSEHPIFRNLLAGRNPLIRMVNVDRYFSPEGDWKPPENSTVQVVARLRNQAPLVVERSFGNGRVVVFSSTYAPLWNDLVLGPNALIALQLQSYLAQARRGSDDRQVGAKMQLAVNTEEFRPEAQVVLPGGGTGSAGRLVLDKSAVSADDEQDSTALLSLGRNASDGFVGETHRAGVYEVWLTRLTGGVEVQRFALNVEPAEGDLTTVEPQSLMSSVAPARPSWRYSEETQFESLNPANLPPSLLIMILLIGLLLAEQALGYAASYHTLPGGSRS